MKQVNEEMTVKGVLNTYPVLMDTFKKYGLGKFENPEVLVKLGSILKLKTALKAAGINNGQFIELLNSIIMQDEIRDNESSSIDKVKDLSLLALMPCGMKMPFNRVFDNFIMGVTSGDNTFNYQVEGNVNHELSYYPYIDTVETVEELPDILISSDFNNFYHQKFRKSFLDKDKFKTLNTEQVNEVFKDTGFPDPRKHFTMLSANLLVIVALKDRNNVPVPSSWEDLLSEEYHNKVAVRGDGNFFCSALLLPFYKLFGMDGIKKLANSAVTGLHPSEMANYINRKKEDAPLFYIMPYFFTKKITATERIEIIIPSEGAIASPVQMLVKKSAAEHVKHITDFICGREMGKVFSDALFPSVNPDVKNNMGDIQKIFWLGWDFIYSQDIGELKETLGEVFLEEFKRTGGKL